MRASMRSCPITACSIPSVQSIPTRSSPNWSHARTRATALALVVAALALLALAWRFTPLHEWLSLDRLVDAGEALENHAYAPLIVLVVYVVGGLLAFPLIL